MAADLDVLGVMQQAARLLRGAHKVPIATGAGMSADSNIPTYRDKHGRWREFTPFVSKGLIPEEFANPPGFQTRPQHAWAFHEWLRRVVATNAPLTATTSSPGG
jgi:NAD-dependent SIR2 family protein deacetylase